MHGFGRQGVRRAAPDGCWCWVHSAQNRQENRDRVGLEEHRRRAARTRADTEYLARELAVLRLAVGEVVTREYLRRELEALRTTLTELQAEGADGEAVGA